MCILQIHKVELLQVYFRYTLNILQLKTNIIEIMQSLLIVILKHIVCIILRNMHYAINTKFIMLYQ